jgi:hypothetical protein
MNGSTTSTWALSTGRVSGNSALSTPHPPYPEFRDRWVRAEEEGADTVGGSAAVEDLAQSVAIMAVCECASRSNDEYAESSR